MADKYELLRNKECAYIVMDAYHINPHTLKFAVNHMRETLQRKLSLSEDFNDFTMFVRSVNHGDPEVEFFLFVL